MVEDLYRLSQTQLRLLNRPYQRYFLQYPFLALDDMEKGFGRKIPLWLFGFLY